jgi:hypothetical protein
MANENLEEEITEFIDREVENRKAIRELSLGLIKQGLASHAEGMQVVPLHSLILDLNLK